MSLAIYSKSKTWQDVEMQYEKLAIFGGIDMWIFSVVEDPLVARDLWQLGKLLQIIKQYSYLVR